MGSLKLSRSLEFIAAFFKVQQVINTGGGLKLAPPDQVGLSRAQIRLIWFCLLGTVTYVLYPLYFLFNSRHIFYHHTENPKNDHHCEICDKYFFCLSDLKVHTNRSSLISESFSFVQNMCQFTILSTIHFSIMILLLRIFECTSCLKTYYIYLWLVNSELLFSDLARFLDQNEKKNLRLSHL